MRIALAALALVPVLGCAPAARPPGPAELAGRAAVDLLVLPLNLATPMPPELDAMSPVVWKGLESYLREHGKQLKTVAPEDARRLWVGSVREVRAAGKGDGVAYAEAARVLVGRLARSAAFDAVIAPSLFVRQAQIYDRTARWDGVERAVEIETLGRAGADVEPATKLKGVAPAASLHVVVLDAGGNVLQEKIAGIELLGRVVARRKESGALQLDFATRTDLFSDPAPLRAAIARALAPFVPDAGAERE
jgi:hypothetical protein